MRSSMEQQRKRFRQLAIAMVWSELTHTILVWQQFTSFSAFASFRFPSHALVSVLPFSEFLLHSSAKTNTHIYISSHIFAVWCMCASQQSYVSNSITLKTPRCAPSRRMRLSKEERGDINGQTPASIQQNSRTQHSPRTTCLYDPRRVCLCFILYAI